MATHTDPYMAACVAWNMVSWLRSFHDSINLFAATGHTPQKSVKKRTVLLKLIVQPGDYLVIDR